MQLIEINSVSSEEVIRQLHAHFEGDLREQWGEYVLEFDNHYGKGLIQIIDFDWGISLINYDVVFTEALQIGFSNYKLPGSPLIKFIFVSEGSLQYCNQKGINTAVERYQNVIIASGEDVEELYVFPGKTAIKVNFIYVRQKEYAQKKNNNLSSLHKKLFDTFQEACSTSCYFHFGNFNLNIADHIRQLRENYDHGIVRTLSIEGHLNMIMALQISACNNYENEPLLPESLSRADIVAIQKLSEYISNNIAEPMSVPSLASVAGISPKKLQLGFRTLYSKSVNRYIQQLKLEIARDRIKNTSDSISEIVYGIGLKSRSYFSKIFFEKYGILPTDYRKNKSNTLEP